MNNDEGDSPKKEGQEMVSPERVEKAMLDGLKSEHVCHVVFKAGGSVTETHYPPSRGKRSGVHVQVGEGGEYFHRDLKEVLAGILAVDDPATISGGVVRDIMGGGPIGYGNEMRINPYDVVVQIGGAASREGFGDEVRHASAPASQSSIDGAHNRPLVPLNIENAMSEPVLDISKEREFFRKILEEE